MNTGNPLLGLGLLHKALDIGRHLLVGIGFLEMRQELLIDIGRLGLICRCCRCGRRERSRTRGPAGGRRIALER